jgi:HlyD family secretion protein
MIAKRMNRASQTFRNASTLVWVLIAVAVVALAVGAVALRGGGDANTRQGPTLHTVGTKRIDVIVQKDGELQAVENIELISRVEGRTTITEIVREGSLVNKGDVVVQLDSSPIRQQIEDARLELQRSDAAVANARELLAIQVSNNAAELEGAEVSLMLAEIELKKFLEGTFPQQEKTAQTRLDMARINVDQRAEDFTVSRKLFTRGFVTAAEIKKQELAVTEARNNLAEAETAIKVLRDYTFPAEQAAKQNAVSQARSRLERVRRQNESMLTQKQNDLDTAVQQLETRQRKLVYLQEQLQACTLVAPEAGMVVYVNNRDQQTVIQQGTEVRERQAIVRLPNTSSMKAVLRVSEGQVTRLAAGQKATITVLGYPKPLNGTVSKVSIVPDSGNRWWNDAKEFPVDVDLDETPSNLKPNTGANVSVFVRSIENTLAVPLTAIYSGGGRSFVFVADGEQRSPREVKIGEASTTDMQILSGLQVGEQVLLLQPGQGKQLLDQAGIQLESERGTRGPRRQETTRPASQPGG